jgi:ABC-type branched-subunit amino acid transport system substrate-binding protein/predicted negative regulator of RcsB-dependent stress response
MTAVAFLPYAMPMAKPHPASDPPFSRVDRARVLWLALAALTALGGCPGHGGPDFGKLPTITSGDPEAEARLREAREQDDKGDHEAAATRYRKLIADKPNDPLVPVAQLALGRILLRSGQHADAKALFDRVATHSDPALAEQGRFYGAIAAHRMGDDEGAVKTLQPMVGRPVDPADTALLLRTLAEAYEKLGRYGDALAALDSLTAEAVPEADRKWAEGEITTLSADKASPEDIERLLRDLPHKGYAFRRVIKRAVRDADAKGDGARAHQLLELMHEEEIPIDNELSAIAVRATRPGEANPQVIGAVLSLSGRGHKVGELALRGLMLAAGLPLQGPPAKDAPQLVFRDDGGEPERAAEAVNELATVHRAIAIIGPLDVRAAEAAADRAQQLGVPIILLSPGGRGPERGPLVHRFFVTPEQEVQSLLARAKSIARSKLAGLLPQGPYGDLMETTLRAQAAAAGAQVLAVQRYLPGATSFTEQAAALAKLPIEAVLLADEPRQVALIAPALAAAGLWCTPAGENAQGGARPITLLAPSVAFDHGLARSAGRYLQGALFSVPFDAQSASGAAQKFATGFEAQFGEPADAFAAFAYDAFKLVRKGVDSGAKTREALGAALARTSSSDLAGPSPGFGLDRQARHPTRLLELKGDAFVPLTD